jgi:hypothetical protein
MFQQARGISVVGKSLFLFVSNVIRGNRQKILHTEIQF